MKFSIGGLEYAIVFGYSEEKYLVGHPMDSELIVSRSVICRLIAESPGNALLGHGTARCNPADNFRKETGRKLALTRAIAHAQLTKPDRAMIWAAYLSRAKVSPAGCRNSKKKEVISE